MTRWVSDLNHALTVKSNRLSWFGEALRLEGDLEQALRDHLYLAFYTAGSAVPTEQASESLSGVNSEVVEHYTEAYGSSQLFADPPCPGDNRRAGIAWDVTTRDPGFGGARLSPGFISYSSHGMLSHDQAPRLRVYLNLWPPGVIELLRYLGGNSHGGIVHTVKALRPPYGALRTDVAVVYLSHTEPGVYRSLIRALDLATQGLRRAATPALTYRVTDGIAVAIGPVSGESFGMHRCELISRAVVKNIDREQIAEPLITDIRSIFQESNVSVNRPYCDRNSRLPDMRIPQYRNRRDSSVNPIDGLVSAVEYGSITNSKERVWLTASASRTSVVDPSSYAGHAGIALALASAASAGNERAHLLATQAAIAALRYASTRRPHGLHFGSTSVLGAISIAHGLLANPVLEHAWHDLADRLAAELDIFAAPLDLLNGLAGVVLALAPTVLLHKGLSLLFDAAASRLAMEIGRITATEDGSLGPGVAHGLSGLLAAASVLDGQEFAASEALHALTRLEDAYFVSGARNWVKKDEAVARRYWSPSQRSWCHGAPGIAIVRKQAGAPMPSGVANSSLVPEGAAGRSDWSLCHGLSGLWAIAGLGLQAPPPVGADGEIRRAARLSRPRSGWWTPPGLMDGRAGVLLAALAAQGEPQAWRALAWAMGVPNAGSEPPVSR